MKKLSSEFHLSIGQSLQKIFKDKESHTSIFSNIYLHQKWGKGSGIGSTIEFNREYIQFLKQFFEEKKITKVVDIGCGDWQFSKEIYLTLEIEYIGIDCVPFLIEHHQATYSNNKIQFFCIDVITDFSDIPEGDLYIAKDVFQHWKDEEIIQFIEKWEKDKKSPYLLVINDKGKEIKWNEVGRSSRGLCHSHTVFNRTKTEYILEYNNKEVFLCSLE